MASGAMKIFSMFGDIFIKDDDVNTKLDKIDSKASKLNVNIKGLSGEAGKSIRQVSRDFELWSVQTNQTSNSSEYLKKKIESLNKALDIMNKDIAKSKEGYEKVVEKFGETSSQAEKYRNKLQNLELSHAKLTNEINNTSKSLESNHDKLKNIEGKISDISGKMLKWTTIATATAAAVSGALLKIASDTSETARQITVMSEKTSISTQRLQEWQYAAAQTGVEMDSFNDGIENLSGVIGDVLDGSKDKVKIFKELGVSVKGLNGTLRNQGDIYKDIIMKLADMDDKTKRNVIGSKLFGDSFLKLTPFLNQGSKGIAALTNEAHSLGLIMSDEAIKSSTEFGNTMNSLKSIFESTKNSIGIDLIPMFQSLADNIKDNGPEIRNTITGVADVLGGVITFGVNNFPTIIGLVKLLSAAWLTQKGVLAVLAINKGLNWVADMAIGLQTALNTKGTLAYTVAQKANTAATGLATGVTALFGGTLQITGKQLLIVAVAIGIVVGLILLLTKGFGAANSEIKNTMNSLNNFGNIKTPNVSYPNAQYPNMNQYANSLPGLAKGGKVLDEGEVLVGETAPEILRLPRGATVTPLDKAEGEGNEVNNFYGDVNISARDLQEMQDIADFFTRLKQVHRQGG